jgi:hypothetical protein
LYCVSMACQRYLIFDCDVQDRDAKLAGGQL